MALEDYRTVYAVLGRVLNLEFELNTAENSEDYPEDESVSVAEMGEEGLPQSLRA